MKAEQVWQAALGELQLQMTQATFDTWLRDSTLLERKDGLVVIGVKSGYAKDWLEHRLLGTVKRTLARLGGQAVEVKFVAMSDNDQKHADTAWDSAISTRGGPVIAGPPVVLEGVYGSAYAAIVRPEVSQPVANYDVDNWLPVLGPQRWALVKVLRRLALGAPPQSDGTRRMETSLPELARRLGLKDPSTLGGWLKSEEIPGRAGWRRIEPTDEQSKALGLFIPRLRYRYVHDGSTKRAGFILYVRMDDPLVEADLPRLREMARLLEQASMEQMPLVAGLDGIHSLHRDTAADAEAESNGVGEITRSIRDIEPELGPRQARAQLAPIARATARLLGDLHSLRMYQKVLQTLYRGGHLSLYTEALEIAVDTGTDDPRANLGAVFVTELKQLGEECETDVGFISNSA